MKRLTFVLLLAGVSAPGLAATPHARPSSSAAAAESRGYQLAFVDADVKRVVDAVLGAMLSVDYSVDPKVEGNVTLRTTKPVSRDALIPLLESALAPLNAVIVADGSTYRVVPRESARTSARFAGDGDTSSGPAGFATEVVELKNASAREMSKLLEQFLGKEVVAGTSVARNQILITGTGEERAAAKALIARFDVDSLASMNFEFRKLENVDPDTLAGELEKIFQPPLDIIGSRVKLVPLPRLRSILLIAANRADFDRVIPWIQRLDSGGAGKPKLYSYAVQNGLARDLARSLQAVLGTGGSSSTAITSTTVQPVSTNGSEAARSRVAEAPPPPESSATSLYSTQSPEENGPRIVPNEANNSLLIYATGEQYEFIREVLEKVDQPAAQVLIEATLAEVTLSNDLSYGIDWRKLDGNDTITLSSNSGGVPASIFPGFSYSYVGSSARAVLNTLQSKTNVRVLSAPRLLVLNNQTASLQVGDQVPLVTQQAQSVSAAGAPIVNTVELRDTGVILKVTPRVNESGSIILDIDQEVSDAVPTTSSGISSPTIQQRKLSSTVSTRSGQMIALGGLIRDRVTRGKSGVPLLSQIPLVGAAFGTHSTRNDRTELIILLTPTVMRSPEEIRATVNELIDHLDLARPLVERAKLRQVGAPRPTQ